MGTKISILIADDEPYSRQELVHLLSDYEDLQVIGEAESGEQAVIQCLQLQPDAVFLDIEMPKMNGMETARSLNDLKKVPKIIFATAYPQFAAEAFRYEAVDYLLKPYDEELLKETVSRLRKFFADEGETAASPINPGKLAVEEDGNISYIDPASIIYILREEKVSRIVAKNGTYFVKMPLKELESRLQHFPFFRIHKSTIVHLPYVARLTPWFNGAYQLEVEGSEEVLSVSRNYAKALRSRLEI
jgi:two-component system, LytTR family, response regulator LytT